MKGRIRGKLCTVATAYAPYTNQVVFTKTMLALLGGFAEGDIILMGDFNLTWHSGIDSTHPHRSPTGSFLKSLKQATRELGLIDA